MAKQRNTHEKRLREQLKRHKSEDKRNRRIARKTTPEKPVDEALPSEEPPAT